MLDLLLETTDLPQGWVELWETRYRVGFIRNGAHDKRARRQRLVGATCAFRQPEIRSHVIAGLSPAATEQDAHTRLAEGRARQAPPVDLIPQVTEEIEVTPPPEAGEHARAFLTTITPRDGAARRQLHVIWVEPGQPILSSIIVYGPAVLDLWAFTSVLVQRQRERLGAAHLHSAGDGISRASATRGARGRFRISRAPTRWVVRSMIVFALLAVALHTVARSTTPTLGHFAGYQETDTVVHKVSATITVPRIRPASAYSYASTWVGAQVLGQDYMHLPFVQVGVNEEESGYQAPADQAFWSDNAHHFESVPLFRVRPGDRVSVSLSHAHRHWIITAVDGTTRRQIVTAQEGWPTFRLADWVQEDTDVGSHLWVYPTMTDIHISNLSINGASPSQSALYPDLMSTGHSGREFEPTALTNNAFTVVPR